MDEWIAGSLLRGFSQAQKAIFVSTSWSNPWSPVRRVTVRLHVPRKLIDPFTVLHALEVLVCERGP